jgi:hypothetical protein
MGRQEVIDFVGLESIFDSKNRNNLVESKDEFVRCLAYSHTSSVEPTQGLRRDRVYDKK